MFDAALTSEDLEKAIHLVAGVRHVARIRIRPSVQARAARWLDEATSETRLRAMLALIRGGPERLGQIERLLRAAGRVVVPKLIALIAGVADPDVRRTWIDLSITLGLEGPEALAPLFASEDAGVAADGVYMLAQIGTPASRSGIMAALEDPRPQVREAALAAAHQLGPEAADAIAPSLHDPDPELRIAAARALVTTGSRDAARVIGELVRGAGFDAEPLEVKQILLESYAILNEARGLFQLEKYLKQADGLLAKKEHEDVALAAIAALVHVRTQRTVDILKVACGSKRRRVAEAAREALLRLKGAK
jgi:HEAT repeat protein